MTKTMARPYPLEPLKRHMILRCGGEKPKGGREAGLEYQFSTTRAMEFLGITDSKWWKLCRVGYLTESEADEFALKLGLHPALLWPDVYAELP